MWSDTQSPPTSMPLQSRPGSAAPRAAPKQLAPTSGGFGIACDSGTFPIVAGAARASQPDANTLTDTGDPNSRGKDSNNHFRTRRGNCTRVASWAGNLMGI